jgi:16S rRNA processing protein RimM
VLLIVGQIVRPHGLLGEVIINVRTDEPAQLVVETVRPHQGRLLVTFDGVYDRDVADQLRGVLLQVDSADVPHSDDPDEFGDHELVGLTAVTPAGERLGEIERIEHAPSSDLLVLRRPEGRTALVPFVKAIVPEVDLAGGQVVVTPPEGLFDL